MRLKSTLAALAVLASASFAALGQEQEFLAPEDAYSYEVSAQKDRILVSWIITPGYYLYRKRMSFESVTPGVTLGETVFPKGEMHHDENLGDDEVYRGTATFELPFTIKGVRPSEVALKLNWQGCADAGLCYPPSTWDAKVKLPAQKARAVMIQPTNTYLAAGLLSFGNLRLASAGAEFKTVKTAAELDQAVAAASKQGKRAMLDFTADWCAPCKKMEKTTFADPAVKAALSNYVLLRIDVTKSTAEDAALLKRFKAFGPPVIAFFDTQGQEVSSCKVTGYVEPGKFREHITACQKG